MKKLLLVTLVAVITLFIGFVGYARWHVEDIPPISAAGPSPVAKTMKPFRSDQELKRYFRELAGKRRSVAQRLQMQAGTLNKSVNVPETAAKMDASPGEDESVTNVQHAGVDEGGIVKLHGDHLVMLRRGRLFTVAIGRGALQPISSVDAFGPDIDPQSTWYDELLVSKDTVAVIGYSYERGGT